VACSPRAIARTLPLPRSAELLIQSGWAWQLAPSIRTESPQAALSRCSTRATLGPTRNRIMIYGPKNDGTYIVEFRTAAGEALGITIPRTECAVIRHFQDRMPYGLFVPDHCRAAAWLRSHRGRRRTLADRALAGGASLRRAHSSWYSFQ